MPEETKGCSTNAVGLNLYKTHKLSMSMHKISTLGVTLKNSKNKI
jgi:hypothetical protein